MPEISPTLTQQITDLIANINTRDATFRDWISGTADGGPNSDGYYPLADAHGKTFSVPCPAKLADMATGPAAISVAAKDGAEAALATATAKAADATDAKTLAEASKVAAIAARDLAQSHRSHAATHEATARYWAEQAQSQGVDVSGMFGTITELAQQVAANTVAADVSADAAADSAALAAHFEPNNFDLKSDPIAANRIIGTISFANLPSLPGANAYFSTGGFANITTADQTAMKTGDYVTLGDGRRWQYKGTGSKTDQASYVFITDDTPDYNTLANLPTQFLPSPHSHSHTDINGFTWANLNAKPNVAIQHTDASFAALSANGWPVWTSGNFDPDGKASVAHSHAASDVTSGVFDAARIPDLAQSKITGLTAALSDKAALAHSHAWADITGKPNLAIQNEGVAFSDLSVRQGAGGYVNLAPGNADWTGYVQFFHANGNRAGYIGFANASGNQIRLAADAPNGGFSFSHRPDFNGAAPWDSLNLPGPATTNTVQQINARKVFKSDVGGTALTASYTNRPLEVQSLASADDALMSFHIPGVRANTFGLRANGDWAAAGQKLWHEGNHGPGSGLNADTLDGLHASNIMPYNTQRDFANGTLIVTDIPYDVTNGDAWKMEITGNTYGSGRPANTSLQGYIYNGTMINCAITQLGFRLTGVIAIQYGTALAFWWPRQAYWHGYTVKVTSASEGYQRNRISTVLDVAQPGSTKLIQFSGTSLERFIDYEGGSQTGYSIPSRDSDGYLNQRVIRNLGPGINDGMYIGYANSGGGMTRVYGGGSTYQGLFVGVDGIHWHDTGGNLNRVWASGQIPTDTWQRDTQGHDRFHFGANSHTSIKTRGSFLFRNAADGDAMTLDGSGNMVIAGSLNAVSSVSASTYYTGNWYRSTGATGWFNQTYTVGIYADRAGQVRTYNGASFEAEGGLTVGGHRVPKTTYSQGGSPSGGVDGDVHIVW